jgi:hypothetical protein
MNLLASLKAFLTKAIDWAISKLPSPLVIPAVWLFQPKLYNLIQNAKGITTQGNCTVITYQQGHIVVTDGEIKVL